MGRRWLHHGLEQEERVEDSGPPRPWHACVLFCIQSYNAHIYGRHRDVLQEPGQVWLEASAFRPEHMYAKPVRFACVLEVGNVKTGTTSGLSPPWSWSRWRTAATVCAQRPL